MRRHLHRSQELTFVADVAIIALVVLVDKVNLQISPYGFVIGFIVVASWLLRGKARLRIHRARLRNWNVDDLPLVMLRRVIRD